MTTDVPVIRIRGLHVGFGRKAVLRGVDLDVPEGATTVLLGSNGEGKTTLLRTCLGVLGRRAGSVHVLGLDPLRAATRLRRQVGWVPSVPDAWGWMRVGDWFHLLAAHHRTWSATRARDLVERLDVPTDTPFRAMSRGQGMKAMLAGALAPEPRVLLLDEPFAGLDPLVREEVLRSVIGALDGEARTVLLATHDLDVAARIADRVAVLAGGRIAREAPVGAFQEDGCDGASPADLRRVLAEEAKEVA